MIVNIHLTAAPKYIFLPIIYMMDLESVGSNNSANQGCNSIVIIPNHAYFLASNIFETLRKSFGYVPKIIV